MSPRNSTRSLSLSLSRFPFARSLALHRYRSARDMSYEALAAAPAVAAVVWLRRRSPRSQCDGDRVDGDAAACRSSLLVAPSDAALSPSAATTTTTPPRRRAAANASSSSSRPSLDALLAEAFASSPSPSRDLAAVRVALGLPPTQEEVEEEANNSTKQQQLSLSSSSSSSCPAARRRGGGRQERRLRPRRLLRSFPGKGRRGGCWSSNGAPVGRGRRRSKPGSLFLSSSRLRRGGSGAAPAVGARRRRRCPSRDLLRRRGPRRSPRSQGVAAEPCSRRERGGVGAGKAGRRSRRRRRCHCR